MKDLEAYIQSVSEKLLRKTLSEVEVAQMSCALRQFRHLFDDLLERPDILIRDLFTMSATSKMIFPCDIIELRDLLDSKQISINSDITPLFSNKFAQSYLMRQSIHLTIDVKKLDVDKLHAGGLVICNGPTIDISKAILRIAVNRPASMEAVKTAQTIVKDIMPEVEFGVNNSVPGLSSPMLGLSSKKSQMTKLAQLEIRLTPEEASIFNKLKNLRDKAGLHGSVEMRVAGGWVRDKMLGKDSDDIDIALSGMTGAEFLKAIGLRGATIQANPDKSKHLETVKAKIDGQEVDFVNLRSESYSDSRIPEMKMGTPEEDARRRDLTINAMFFNIETGQVEDYVGGREDLKNMVLRTPLDPVQTFLDDPLRMMRVLRFNSRYPNSTVDPAIIQAMAMPQVREAFQNKVSPERSGPEFMKLMMGENPESAMRILFETDLYKNVFNVPEMQPLRGIRMDQQNEHHKLDLMNHTLEVIRNLNKLMMENGEDPKMRGLMNMAAVFHDFGKLHPEMQQPHPSKPGQMQYKGHEDMSAVISDSVMKSIGIGKDERNLVNKIVSLHMRPHVDSWSPKAMGRFLRETEIKGQERDDLWKYIMYHSIADSMAKGSDDYHDDVNLKRQHMSGFENYIQNRQQQAVPVGKPLLNGQEVMAIVPELDPKTGFIKDINTMLLQMQDSGEITTPEEARQKVMEWKAQNLSIYQQGNVQSMNWFKRIKKADSSGGGGGGDAGREDFHPYEGTPFLGQDDEQTWYDRVEYKETNLEGYPDEIVHLKKERSKPAKGGPSIIRDKENDMVYRGESVQLPLRPGEQIRDRRIGTAMKQRFGKVLRIENNAYVVKWDDNDKPESFQLNDTVGLAKVLARV